VKSFTAPIRLGPILRCKEEAMRTLSFGLWLASVAWTAIVVLSQLPGPAY
jgi:hypothetical protein